jgi:glucose-1-phosphate cytidylyltransferase
VKGRAEMKAVILCGGKGTRIQDVAHDMPKPMVSIGNKPILWHIMKIFSAHGINDFVLCLGHKGWKIKEYFLTYKFKTSDFTLDLGSAGKPCDHGCEEELNWRITFAETGLESMTAYRVRRVRKYLAEETFMLTYGDGVANINISDLLRFHRSHGKLVTITAVRPPSRFGELELVGKEVSSFHEKPQVSTGLINGGFFVCEPGLFDYLPDDESCMFETTPLQMLARDKELMAYVHSGFWQPMDTSREHQLLNNMWSSGKAAWKIW